MKPGDKCWVEYADRLRKIMFQQRVFELRIPVETIKEESNSSESLEKLRAPQFWAAVRRKDPVYSTLPDRGVLVDFEPNADGRLDFVLFRLDEDRGQYLQRIIDRGMTAAD